MMLVSRVDGEEIVHVVLEVSAHFAGLIDTEGEDIYKSRTLQRVWLQQG
jgi:hypothetical protein